MSVPFKAASFARLLLSACFARSSSPLPRPQFLPLSSRGSVNPGRPPRCTPSPPAQGGRLGGRQTSSVMMKRWQVGGGGVRPPIKPVGSTAGGRLTPPARPVISPAFYSRRNELNIPYKGPTWQLPQISILRVRVCLATSLVGILAGGCWFGSPPESSQQLCRRRRCYCRSWRVRSSGSTSSFINFIHSLVVLNSCCCDAAVSVHLLNCLRVRLATIL